MKFLKYLLIFSISTSGNSLCDIDRHLSKTDQEIDLFYGHAADERGAGVQMKSISNWVVKIEECKKLPPDEAIPILGSAVFKISQYNIYQSPDRIPVFDSARNMLMSIPGHARYFVKELDQQRASLRPDIYPSAYHNLRRKYIYGTLSQLPSPETIQVLGNYLFDERDDPPPPDPTHFNDADPVPSSTQLAYEAIMDIGLRNPPITRKSYWAVEKDRVGHARSLSRTWSNQIKAGERPFSFIGQTVEYRFKPDGTVESTPLPESVLEQDPKPPAPVPAAPVTRPQDDVTDTQKSSPDASVWSLIAGGILALAAVFYWLRSRRTARPE